MPPRWTTNCWFLVGPTASGKTAAALELAPHINAEIIALDSMTLYRGMDIGTAKPDQQERARVPHHLLDQLDIDQEYSVAEYLRAAEDTAAHLGSRGKTPLFVGGSGLYLRALLRGVFEGPAADWSIRARWEQHAESHGADSVHAELARVDPAAARRLHPHDLRRVIRALEVYELTGRPLSEQQRQAPPDPPLRPRHVYWLAPPRSWLHERIDRRVDAMFAAGLVEEVTRLRDTGRSWSRTARHALGYAEVLDHLAGRQSLAETVTLVQRHTRQFAKRQETWFRNLEECRPLPISGAETPTEIAAQLLHLARAPAEGPRQ